LIHRPPADTLRLVLLGSLPGEQGLVALLRHQTIKKNY